MSQSEHDAFGFDSIPRKKQESEWWEDKDAFAPSSLRLPKKVVENPQEEQAEFPSINPKAAPQRPNKQQHTKVEIQSKKVSALRVKKDGWLARRGHTLSYAGLFLFTLVVYFRPYELIPQLSAFSSMAFVLAMLTLAIFLPTQLSLEGNLTIRPTEVNLVLLLVLFGLITVPIARDPALAWESFNDTFIKAVLMFIVMVNVVRTEQRLKGMMWLAILVGAWLSLSAIESYRAGEFDVEGYRVSAGVRGLFGNANDMALHLVTMTPITLALLMSANSMFKKIIYGFALVLLIAGNTVTFSRGGFLGLIASMAVMLWKAGRRNRFKVIFLGGAVFLGFLIFAPGNYGLRLLSIFFPGMDPNGSSTQRREILMRSIFVTLRNPWGIGMGNFPIVSIQNLVSHNAYTQVSAELGVLALACYVAFIVKPLKRLAEIERELFDAKESSRFYYLAIGLQASLIGYMIGSFFASVAYQWFIYYLVAYAVAFRRIYALRKEEPSVNFVKA